MKSSPDPRCPSPEHQPAPLPNSVGALSDLARGRLAAGVAVYLERGAGQNAPGKAPSWIRVRLDAAGMDKLIAARDYCTPGVPTMQAGAAGRFAADPWWAACVTGDTCMFGENSAMGFNAVAGVEFEALFGTLNSAVTEPVAATGRCFWYGGAVVCAESAAPRAIESLQQHCPELAARQREMEMAAAIAARTALPMPAFGAAPRRRVARV